MANLPPHSGTRGRDSSSMQGRGAPCRQHCLLWRKYSMRPAMTPTAQHPGVYLLYTGHSLASPGVPPESESNAVPLSPAPVRLQGRASVCAGSGSAPGCHLHPSPFSPCKFLICPPTLSLGPDGFIESLVPPGDEVPVGQKWQEVKLCFSVRPRGRG